MAFFYRTEFYPEYGIFPREFLGFGVQIPRALKTWFNLYIGGRGSTESDTSDTSRHDQRILTKSLESNADIPSNCQICAAEPKEAVISVRVETRKDQATGATKSFASHQ